MPRYFFDIDGDGFPAADEEGTVLSGPQEARAALVTLAGELLHEAGDGFWRTGAWRLQVRDEDGAEVCALAIEGSAPGR